MKYSGFTEGRKGRRVRHIRTTIMAWLIVLVVVLLVLFLGFRVFTSLGYRNLKNSASSQGPQIVFDDEDSEEILESSAEEPSSEPSEESSAVEETEESETIESSEESEESKAPEVEWKSDWVKYGDKVYDYNEDILTFLFLGIDKDGPVEKSPNAYSGGQSDTIFLVVLNPDTKKISLVGINRDTMVDIYMPGVGPNGENLSTTAQIAVQHGFGDGLGYSCELTRDAVSKLFYNLPIHGYASLNRGGIVALNDALGGVTVTIPNDMTGANAAWTKGAVVNLKGNDAYTFIRYRDCTQFESARDRLSRQKIYLQTMAAQALAGTKKDLTLPLTLYQSMKPYIVTDLSVDKISYLATVIAGYSFDGNDIYTLEGSTRMGEKFEEFYPDKKALKKLMFQLFYREVNPATGEYIP